MRFKLVSVLVLWMGVVSCNNNGDQNIDEAPVTVTVKRMDFQLVKILPHDISSFTEGLLVYDKQLFESTGAPLELPQTRSLFGIVDFNTGKISVKGELDRKWYFGEGIAVLNGKLFQLTYKNKIGFIYDSKSYKRSGTFSFKNNEGWGLTSDGKSLIMSDGSDTLTFFDPQNFNVVKQIKVTENNIPVKLINELEFVRGAIYANVYGTNTIIKIDTAQGRVVGKMDLTNLVTDATARSHNSLEMNGIAFDTDSNLFYITGKMWPTIYQIQVFE